MGDSCGFVPSQELLAFESGQCLALQLCNRFGPNGKTLFRIGYSCWLSLADQMRIVDIIKSEEQIQILWPSNFKIREPKQMKKELKGLEEAGLTPNFHKEVAIVKSVGDWNHATTKVVHLLKYGKTTPVRADRRDVTRKDLGPDYETENRRPRQRKKQHIKKESKAKKGQLQDGPEKTQKLEYLTKAIGEASSSSKLEMGSLPPRNGQDSHVTPSSPVDKVSRGAIERDRVYRIKTKVDDYRRITVKDASSGKEHRADKGSRTKVCRQDELVLDHHRQMTKPSSMTKKSSKVSGQDPGHKVQSNPVTIESELCDKQCRTSKEEKLANLDRALKRASGSVGKLGSDKEPAFDGDISGHSQLVVKVECRNSNSYNQIEEVKTEQVIVNKGSGACSSKTKSKVVPGLHRQRQKEIGQIFGSQSDLTRSKRRTRSPEDETKSKKIKLEQLALENDPAQLGSTPKTIRTKLVLTPEVASVDECFTETTSSPKTESSNVAAENERNDANEDNNKLGQKCGNSEEMQITSPEVYRLVESESVNSHPYSQPQKRAIGSDDDNDDNNDAAGFHGKEPTDTHKVKRQKTPSADSGEIRIAEESNGRESPMNTRDAIEEILNMDKELIVINQQNKRMLKMLIECHRSLVLSMKTNIANCLEPLKVFLEDDCGAGKNSMDLRESGSPQASSINQESSTSARESSISHKSNKRMKRLRTIKRRKTYNRETKYDLGIEKPKIARICSSSKYKTSRKVVNATLELLFSKEELINSCPFGSRNGQERAVLDPQRMNALLNACYVRFRDEDDKWYDRFKAAVKTIQVRLREKAAHSTQRTSPLLDEDSHGS